MDNIVKGYMKRINDQRLAAFVAEVLVDMWNDYVDNYGFIRVQDILALIEGDYMRRARYVDFKYGWTEHISLEKNFKVVVKGNYVYFITKLPKPVLLGY